MSGKTVPMYTSTDAIPNEGNETGTFLVDITRELAKARAKFPDQDKWITLAALTEEVGELNQAILQNAHEPHNGVTRQMIYKEAVQVAVMAARVILDCGVMGDV